MISMRFRKLLTALVLLSLGSTLLAAQELKLDRVQLSVILSPSTFEAMGEEARALSRTVESALAARGMGTALPGLQSRFVAYVEVVPLQEEMVPGGGMVAVKEQVSITFGDSEGGRTFGSFVVDARGVGRSKETALRNLATNLNLRSREDFQTALDHANHAIVTLFERQCTQLLAEADAKMKQKEFDEAMYLTTTVPREAADCHGRAMAFAGEVYVARMRAQCVGPFAAGRARWAALKTRESAVAVANIIGEIPADSPCFADASTLLESVAAVIGGYDEAEAQKRRAAIAFERKQYEDRLALVRTQMQHDNEMARQQQTDATATERARLQGEAVVAAAAIEAAREVGIQQAQIRAQQNAGASNSSGTRMSFSKM